MVVEITVYMLVTFSNHVAEGYGWNMDVLDESWWVMGFLIFVVYYGVILYDCHILYHITGTSI